MRQNPRPLYVWTIWLSITGDNITPDIARDVAGRLHYLDATAGIDNGLVVRVQYAVLFEAARAGVRSSRVDVVHARRSTAASCIGAKPRADTGSTMSAKGGRPMGEQTQKVCHVPTRRCDVPCWHIASTRPVRR